MKDNKNKGAIVTVAVLAIVAVVALLVAISINQRADNSNDSAVKNNTERKITIINNTGQVINEAYITVESGAVSEGTILTKPDNESFSLTIPKQYKDYSTFIVVLIDRYDMKYQKKITDVPQKGVTYVEINEEDYVESKGDFWNKIDKFFNGDL